MRRSLPAAGILGLALLAVGCAAKPPPAGPLPTSVAAAPDVPRMDGFAGEIEPLSAPIALAYRPARFRGVTTIGVQAAGGPPGRAVRDDQPDAGGDGAPGASLSDAGAGLARSPAAAIVGAGCGRPA